MIRILALFSIVMLSGCVSDSSVIKPEDHFVLQEDLIRPCPDLRQLQVKDYSQAESFEAVKRWSQQYKECQLKHKALTDVLSTINK